MALLGFVQGFKNGVLAAAVVSQISPQGELKDKVRPDQGFMKVLLRLC